MVIVTIPVFWVVDVGDVELCRGEGRNVTIPVFWVVDVGDVELCRGGGGEEEGG